MIQGKKKEEEQSRGLKEPGTMFD